MHNSTNAGIMAPGISDSSPWSAAEYQSLVQPVSKWRHKTACQTAEKLTTMCIFGDLFVIALAQISAYFLRFHVLVQFGNFGQPSLFSYNCYIGAGTILMMWLLSSFQVYEKRKPFQQFDVTAPDVLKAISVWFLVFSCASYVFHISPPLSRGYVTIAGLLMLLGLTGWRFLFRFTLEKTNSISSLSTRVLFVGWTEDTSNLYNTFAKDTDRTHLVVGCVRPPTGHFQKEPPAGVPQVGDFSDIKQVLQTNEVDMVIINELNYDRGEVIELANLCEREMVEFKVVPSFFQILVSGLHLETLHGVPVLGVNSLPLDKPFNLLFKRFLDVVGSIVGLIIAAPFVLFFGLLVYLESPGNIFYLQKRAGRRGGVFKIIKIRSMKLDSEANGAAGWTTENDPRCLKVGAFMRKWNIDEIPQFWNVLKGEMSLVGPRPERPEHIINFKEDIPHYNARHNVKPGITGLAQIRGLRGDTDLSKRIQSDLYYLENWSLFSDINILFRTFFARKNAY